MSEARRASSGTNHSVSRKSWSFSERGERSSISKISVATFNDIIPVEITDSHAFELTPHSLNGGGSGGAAFNRKKSTLYTHNEEMAKRMDGSSEELGRRINEMRNAMRCAEFHDDRNRRAIRNGDKLCQVTEPPCDMVRHDVEMQGSTDVAEPERKNAAKAAVEKSAKNCQDKDNRKRKTRNTKPRRKIMPLQQDPNFMEDMKNELQNKHGNETTNAIREVMDCHEADEGDNDQGRKGGLNRKDTEQQQVSLPLINIEKRMGIAGALNTLATQKQEETIKSLLVKRIQAQACVREKYKRCYGEVNSRPKNMPPRRLVSLKTTTVVKDNNAYDNEAQTQPLLDDRFVSLMKSLEKTKKDFTLLSTHNKIHRTIGGQ
eukprot:gene15389-16968_t